MSGQLILVLTAFLTLKAVVLVLAWWALMPLLMDRIFLPRREPPSPLPESVWPATEDVTVATPDATLKAWLVRPADATGVAVIAHGWGQEAGRMGKIAAALVGPYSLPLLLDDLRAVRDWVAGRPDLAGLPSAIVGFSFGGMGAMISVAGDDRWEAGVAIGSPSAEPRAILFHLARQRGVPARLVLALMMPFLRRRPGAKPEDLDAARLLTGVSVPILVVHGTADPTVPASEGERMAAAVPGGLGTLRLVEGGGHSDVLDRDDVAAEVAAFVPAALSRPQAGAGSRE